MPETRLSSTIGKKWGKDEGSLGDALIVQPGEFLQLDCGHCGRMRFLKNNPFAAEWPSVIEAGVCCGCIRPVCMPLPENYRTVRLKI